MQLAMRPLPYCLLIFIGFLAPHAAPTAQLFDDYEMAYDEADAAYDILESINDSVQWRTLHPENLCLFGPHGLNCDIDENNVLHVVEFNFGWVADSDNNPQCGRNATISTSLLRLPYLKKLLFYNCFREAEIEIPSVIWSLGGSLQHLVFMKNPALVGRIPGELSKLSNLERLVLMENGLQGPISAGIGSLKRLKQLVLSENKLTGFIPNSLGNLQSLKVLDLNGNKLQGRIPVELSKLVKLDKLDLSNNALNESMPSEIGSLTALQLLDLSQNSLSGCLSTSIGSLSQLRIMQLSNNNFTGAIPDSIWSNLTLLVGLALSNAGLQGRIPSALGELPHLNYLDLSGNKLEGTIPSTLGHLPHVYQINLSHNELFGLVPFHAEFVSRLGRNLQLTGNRGLCVGSDWTVLPNGLAIDGLEICDDEYWSSAVVKQSSLTAAAPLVSSCASQPGVILVLVIGSVLL